MNGPRDKKKTTPVQLCDTCARLCKSAEECKIYPDEERMFNNPSAHSKGVHQLLLHHCNQMSIYFLMQLQFESSRDDL